MKVFYNINDIDKKKNTVLTVGTFDGVHLGHHKLLNEVRYHATDRGGRSFVITFNPHPRTFLHKDNNFKILTSLDEKIRLLEKFAIQNVLVLNFDEQLANTHYEDFVKKYLVEKIGISEFIIGHDHQFGKDREGNKAALTNLSKAYDFNIFQISEQRVSSIVISSSKIRKALLEGNIPEANNQLGRKYSIEGVVSVGRKFGKTIGFPTANVEINDINKLIPKEGVYFVEVIYNDQIYFGMMNIGYRPTVSVEKILMKEVHIFNFDNEIYNEKLIIKFIDRIRDEIKFSNVEGLISQLNKDKTECLKRIN